MPEFHFAWASIVFAALLLSAALSAIGVVGRKGVAVLQILALASAACLFLDQHATPSLPRQDPWVPFLSIDSLSAYLLPFGILLFVVTSIIRPRSSCSRESLTGFSAASLCVACIFVTRDPLLLAVFLTLSAGIYLWTKWRVSETRLRVPLLYLSTSSLCILAGAGILSSGPGKGVLAQTAQVLLILGVAIRKGIFPFHSWLPYSFESGRYASTLLFCTPQVAVYLLIRLVLPHATPLSLEILSVLALLTAVLSAGVASIEMDARRCFAYLFLSQSALVLAGIASHTAEGLTGGITLWLASGIALTGMGLTLRLMEARHGRLDLSRFRGGYEQKPLLAAAFLLLGLASVGFPGTLGFVGQELLVEGEVARFPILGFAVVLSSMICAITVMRCFFYLFCGKRVSATPLRLQGRQLFIVILLVTALFAGGFFPGNFVETGRLLAKALMLGQ